MEIYKDQDLTGAYRNSIPGHGKARAWAGYYPTIIKTMGRRGRPGRMHLTGDVSSGKAGERSSGDHRRGGERRMEKDRIK